MLIINADDYGKDEFTTHRILLGHRRGRISSSSAMVFMEDSARSAAMAAEAGLDVGLHLNLTEKLTCVNHRPLLEDYHKAVAGFLNKTQHYPLYNPLLRRQFDYVYHSQYEEFLRLYGFRPSHVDGHHHMHLCANMIIDRVIPGLHPVRRSFHFFRDEKGVAKRLYRSLLNGWISRHFSSTDYFFDVLPIVHERLLRIIGLSRTSDVELMVHPGREADLDYLLSDRFGECLREARLGSWKELDCGKDQRNRDHEGGATP